MHSCVTVSLVREARGGPFVFWGDLPEACRKARELGFDAIEIFPSAADDLEDVPLAELLEKHHLKLAAVGTGGGWVKHRFRLTDPDRAVRQQALEFIHGIIDVAGRHHAPAIIGSMQGRFGEGGLPRDEGMFYLTNALGELARHAAKFDVPLLFEPLNRYETNIANTLEQGVEIIRAVPVDGDVPGQGDSPANVKLLADLFHMNIEEADMAASIRTHAGFIGHVHLADSNRRPAGCGHMDFSPISQALRDINYAGYVSAEAFPWPDSDQAADLTIQAFFRHFAGAGRSLDV